MENIKKVTKEIKEEFKLHNKRIIRSNKTKNYKTRSQYLREAINSYNKYIVEINTYFDRIGFEDKTTVRSTYLQFKSNILKYIGAYNINNFPEPTDGYHIIFIEDNELELLVRSGLIDDNTPGTSEDESHTNKTSQTEPTMATTISKIDFINACSRHMPINYDGKFDTLRSFINKINFLKELATTAELLTVLKTYVLTKLDQSALSKIPENPDTVDTIIQALKGKIVHETSKVLEGRMIALTLDKKSLVEFQKQALSENYQQALVEEGIPLSIAEKLAIEKTVDLCRKNTRSSEVKAILSATAHSSSSSVISKMITQIDAVRLDKLTQNTKNDKSRGANNSQGQRGKYNKSGRGNGNQNSYENGNNSGNYNKNNNSRGGGNNRGRGRGGHSGRGSFTPPGNGQFYQREQQVFQIQGNGQSPPPQGAQPNNAQQYSQRM
jgi:hypothetical protein